MKACIFDLDGTLCDTVESISHCANLALRELGLKEAGEAEYKLFVGDGLDMLIRRLLAYAGDTDCIRFDVMKTRYAELFKDGCLYKVQAYPGIPELLAGLRSQGMKLAVLSNKPHYNTVKVIDSVFGDGVFDTVIGQSDRFPKKPDPAAALYIAESFGVKPEDCIYLGDTGTDMKTGKAAGMFTVGVLWGFRGRDELIENGADALARDAETISHLSLMDPRGLTGND